MELKCRHTEWEACAKCLDFQQRKTKKEANGLASIPLITTTTTKSVNEVVCCKPWCRKRISVDMFDSHTKTCKRPRSKKSTICPQCNKQFSKVSNLNRHVATVHSVLRKYVCVNCSRSYYDAGKLDKHLQRCNYTTHLSRKHSTGDDEKCFNSDTEEEEREEGDIHDDADLLHVQPDDHLPSMIGIRENITLGTKNENSNNNDNNNSNSSQNYTLIIPPQMGKKLENVKISSSLFNKKKQCVKTQQTKTRHQINNDMKILKKRKRKSTVCSHCGKQFSRVSNLNRHVRTVHGVKKYCCKLCNKSYAFLDKLNLHLRTMHAGSNSSNASKFPLNSPLNSPKIDEKDAGQANGNKKVLLVDKILANKNTRKGLNNKHTDVVDGDGSYCETNKVFVLDNLTMSNTNGAFPVNGEKLFPQNIISTNGERCDRTTNFEFLQKNEENFNSITSVTIVEPDFGDKNLDNDVSGSTHHSNGDNTMTPHSNGVADNDTTNQDSITSTPHSIIGIQKQLQKKKVLCQHCNKQFSKVSNLTRHIFDVHNIRFNCSTCSKSFSNRDKLLKHERNSCNPDKSYKLLKADTALPCMVIDEIFH